VSGLRRSIGRLKRRLDRIEPHEQGALQTIFFWQVLVGAAFFAVVLPTGPPTGVADLIGGMVAAGTLGAAPALGLLLIADASDRRVTWGWPPWEHEPWRGAIWQTGKVFLHVLPLIAAGWLLAALVRVLHDS